MAADSGRTHKSQVRAQARAQAQVLREQQEQAERRRKITRRALIGGGAVAAAGAVAGLVYWDNSTTGTSVPSQAAADASLTFGKGFLPGTTNDGAKVLDVYFDYSCSHCASFDVLHEEEIRTLVEEGVVTLALHPCKILGQPWTDIALNTLGVVLEHEPDKAYAYHNAVFGLYLDAAQKKSGENLNLAGLKKAAEGVGISGKTVAGFDNAVSKNRFEAWIEAGTKTFADKGFTGTPVVAYDGKVLELAAVASPTGLTDQIRSADGAATPGAVAP